MTALDDRETRVEATSVLVAVGAALLLISLFFDWSGSPPRTAER